MVTYTAATRRTQEGIACPPRGAIILVFHYLPSSASLHSPSPVFQKALILPFLIPVIYLNLLHSLEVHLVTPEGQRCYIGPLSTGTHTPTMLEQPVTSSIFSFANLMFYFCRGCQEDEENAVAERGNQYPTGSQMLCLLLCLMPGCVGKILQSLRLLIFSQRLSEESF